MVNASRKITTQTCAFNLSNEITLVYHVTPHYVVVYIYIEEIIHDMKHLFWLSKIYWRYMYIIPYQFPINLAKEEDGVMSWTRIHVREHGGHWKTVVCWWRWMYIRWRTNKQCNIPLRLEFNNCINQGTSRKNLWCSIWCHTSEIKSIGYILHPPFSWKFQKFITTYPGHQSVS